VANPLSIVLAPSGAQSTSGSGAAVDIGALRTAARIDVVITTATAGDDNLLALTLETGPSISGPWRAVQDLGTFLPPAGVQKAKAFVADLEQFVRVSWTISGSGPSFTFQVIGTAHVVYADPAAVREVGARKGLLTNVDDRDLAEFCILVSTEADGHLAIGRTLPLTAWDDDLRLHCAKIVVYRFLNAGGRMPTGPDDLIDTEFKDAVKWLRGVGNGSIDPPGLVDSTPEVNEAAFAVASDPPIEW
jgi:phage gp36-like protein